MVVLDKMTGKEIWRVSRDEKTNWAAPLVTTVGKRTEVIVAGSNKTRSYDLETGKVIWECAGLGANTIPQPVRQDDLVFVMTGYRDPMLMAIRLGREGDLTGTDAIVWSQTKGNSYTPSPVIFDNKLYVLTDTGMVSCYNAKTGEPYYQQTRLPKTYSFKSSPVGANGRLYLASENEDVIVLKMGETFEVLATNTMTDQVFIATPADRRRRDSSSGARPRCSASSREAEPYGATGEGHVARDVRDPAGGCGTCSRRVGGSVSRGRRRSAIGSRSAIRSPVDGPDVRRVHSHVRARRRIHDGGPGLARVQRHLVRRWRRGGDRDCWRAERLR